VTGDAIETKIASLVPVWRNLCSENDLAQNHWLSLAKFRVKCVTTLFKV
jgi:hypothetical protein